MFKNLFRVLILALLGMTCLPALAYTYNMPMPGPDLFVSSMLTQRALQDKLIEQSQSQSSKSKSAQRSSSASLPISTFGNAQGAKRIAMRYPIQERPAAEKLFSQLLPKYYQLAQQLGQSPEDLGAAVASLIAASYMVYNDVDFPDSHFPLLANQIRTIVRSSPEIMASPPDHKRVMFEESAILAMFLAGTKLAAAGAPNGQPSGMIAANMRTSVGAYLETLVGVSANRVKISANGLSIAPE